MGLAATAAAPTRDCPRRHDALRVEGLAPGTYHCLPQRRTLHPIGPAPDLAELKALSSYLSRPADDPDFVGIDDAPAVLAVYLDLGRLRHRYGLRALRLGLLEAGHLTQALLLTAAAFGLAGIPLGGFGMVVARVGSCLDEVEQDPGHAEALVLAEADRQGVRLLVGYGTRDEIQKGSRVFDGLFKSLVGLAVLGGESAQGNEVSDLRTDHDAPSLPLR